MLVNQVVISVSRLFSITFAQFLHKSQFEVFSAYAFAKLRLGLSQVFCFENDTGIPCGLLNAVPTTCCVCTDELTLYIVIARAYLPR